MAPSRRIMSDEELKALIEDVLEKHEPRMEKLIIKVLDQRQELIGLPNHDEEQRAANKADAMFLRAWRLRTDKLANRIGNGVLTAFAAGAIYVAGLGAKKLGWW